MTIISARSIDEDLEMVKKMREILLGILMLWVQLIKYKFLVLKQEYQEILKSIRDSEKPADFWLSRPKDYSAYTSAPKIIENASDLDSLVKRVQEAIGDEPPRSPEMKRYFSGPYAGSNNHHYLASPGSDSETISSELSLASKEYMQKYGLLPPSPVPRRYQNFREPYKPVNPSRLAFEKMPNDVSPSDRHYTRPKSARLEENMEDRENIRILPNIF